jgi:hypothetical protein
MEEEGLCCVIYTFHGYVLSHFFTEQGSLNMAKVTGKNILTFPF